MWTTAYAVGPDHVTSSPGSRPLTTVPFEFPPSNPVGVVFKTTPRLAFHGKSKFSYLSVTCGFFPRSLEDICALGGFSPHLAFLHGSWTTSPSHSQTRFLCFLKRRVAEVGLSCSRVKTLFCYLPSEVVASREEFHTPLFPSFLELNLIVNSGTEAAARPFSFCRGRRYSRGY